MDTGFWVGLTGLITAVLGALFGYLLKKGGQDHQIKQAEVAAQVEALQRIVTDLRAHALQQDQQILAQQDLIGDLYEESAGCQASYGELYGWAQGAAAILRELCPNRLVPVPPRREPSIRRQDAEFRARQAAQAATLLKETLPPPPPGRSP